LKTRFLPPADPPLRPVCVLDRPIACRDVLDLCRPRSDRASSP